MMPTSYIDEDDDDDGFDVVRLMRALRSIAGFVFHISDRNDESASELGGVILLHQLGLIVFDEDLEQWELTPEGRVQLSKLLQGLNSLNPYSVAGRGKAS